MPAATGGLAAISGGGRQAGGSARSASAAVDAPCRGSTRPASAGRTAGRLPTARVATATADAVDHPVAVRSAGRPTACGPAARGVRGDGRGGVERALDCVGAAGAAGLPVCWYSRSSPSRRAMSCSASSLARFDLVVRPTSRWPGRSRPAEEQADDERDHTDHDGASPAAGGRDVEGHGAAPDQEVRDDRRPSPPRWRRSRRRSRQRRPRSARSGGCRRSPRSWGERDGPAVAGLAGDRGRQRVRPAIGDDLAGHLGDRIGEAVEHQHPLVRPGSASASQYSPARRGGPKPADGRGSRPPGVVLGRAARAGRRSADRRRPWPRPGPCPSPAPRPPAPRSSRRRRRRPAARPRPRGPARAGPSGSTVLDRALPLGPQQRQRIAEGRDDLGLGRHHARQAEQRGHVATQPAGAATDGDDASGARRWCSAMTRSTSSATARPDASSIRRATSSPGEAQRGAGQREGRGRGLGGRVRVVAGLR